MKRRIVIMPRFWALLLAVAYAIVGIIMLTRYVRISNVESQVAALSEQVTQLTSANAALTNKIKFASTDAFIERSARGLGMLKPGELRFVSGSQSDGG